MAALKVIPKEFHKYSQQWQHCWAKCVVAHRDYCEGETSYCPFTDEVQTALFKDPVHTGQSTLLNSVIKTNKFMMEVAQVPVSSQINTKHINTEHTFLEC